MEYLDREKLNDIAKRTEKIRLIMEPICADIDTRVVKSEKVIEKRLTFPDWRELKHLPTPHQCSPNCFNEIGKLTRQLRREQKSTSYQAYSPYFKPFLYGFTRRFFNIMCNQMPSKNRRIKQSQTSYYYIAPCGKKLAQFQHIVDFLQATGCTDFLNLSNFTFDEEIRPEVIVQADRRCAKVLDEDFTRGAEEVRIPIVNAVDGTDIPNIKYNRGCYPGPELDVQEFMKNMVKNRQSCSCTHLCNTDSCECVRRSFQFSNKAGLFECNDDCSCSKSGCLNRVVQSRVKIPLELFMTSERGWGVRTLVDIPAETFITSYTGQIISDELADLKIGDDTYLFELCPINEIQEKGGDYTCYLNDGRAMIELCGDRSKAMKLEAESGCLSTRRRFLARKGSNKQEMRDYLGENNSDANDHIDQDAYFVIDAYPESNIGAFFNHSCEPNVETRKVMIATHDYRYHSIGMFANRYIEAGEELSWDYSYKSGSIPGRVMFCKCHKEQCRERML